ncbi:MAG: hypothetical protein P8016_15205 [Sedimentisphaerales bacterium]
MDNYKALPAEEKRRFWQKHIAAWRQSGQSQKEYCRNQKLKKSTLGYWRTLLSREKGFIEIPIKIESRSTIDIIINGGIKIQVRKGFDPELLVQTIRVMEQMS